MDRRKKTIIIILMFLFVLGIFEIFYLFFFKPSVNQEKDESQTPSSQDYSSNVSVFPTDNSSFENSLKKDLPSKSQSPKNNLVGSAELNVPNPNDKNSIISAFSAFISTPSSDTNLRWGEFYDNEKNHLPLDRFLEKIESKINPQLNNLLDNTNYAVFSCGEKNGLKNMGLYINLKLMPNYKGNLYQDEFKFMKSWEPTMLKDLKSILFPGINFSEKDLDQKIVFKDGKYRYGEISLPGNKKKFLNYTFLGDPIVISNSLECIDQASKKLYTPDL